jgi:hypothetical protein
MDQITFLIVWRLLKQASISQCLFGLIILLALLEEETFLGGFYQNRRNIDGPRQALVD